MNVDYADQLARLSFVLLASIFFTACGPEHDAEPGDNEGVQVSGETVPIEPEDATGDPQRGTDSNESEPGEAGPAQNDDEDMPLGCESDLTHFREELWRPILSVQCAGCHQEGSLAAETRMVFVTDDSEDGVLENFERVWNMAQVLEQGESLLVRKPSGRAAGGHTGGELTPVGSHGYVALERISQRARGLVECDEATGEPEEVELGAGPRILRRLSHSEYSRTLASLLAESRTATYELVPDNVVNGYANNAHALWVSPILSEQYNELAEQLATEVLQRQQQWSSCDVSESGTAQCAKEFLEAFGRQCFRRPLSDDELQRYFNLWYGVASEDGFEEGLYWAVTALLQSPHFLYRSELGSFDGRAFLLNDYEIASELSYALTGTMPDSDLMAAAEDGVLTQPEIIFEHAQRIVESGLSSGRFWEFVEAWLGLGMLETVARSEEVYPELTESLRTQMLGQTRRSVEDSFISEGTFKELIHQPRAWLTDQLAEHYGVAPGIGVADSDGFRAVVLPPEYGGSLLEQGSILTTYAKPAGSSPIHRGVLIRERLLCQELPPPPPNLDTSPPAVDPTKSTRERYAEHASNAACSSCHNLIDPIGFGFEHFDGAGRWRLQDGQHPIDVSGEIMGSIQSDTDFEGSSELVEILSESEEVSRCFVQQWGQFIYGLEQEGELSRTVDLITNQALDDGQRIIPMLLSFIQVPHFVERLGDIDEPREPWSYLAPTLNSQALLGGRAEPEYGVAPVGEGLEVAVTEDSRWNAGACFSVAVHNISDTAVEWDIQVAVEGTIDSLWNAELIGSAGSLAQFRGVSWNRSIEPDETASFGFCVSF